MMKPKSFYILLLIFSVLLSSCSKNDSSFHFCVDYPIFDTIYQLQKKEPEKAKALLIHVCDTLDEFALTRNNRFILKTLKIQTNLIEDSTEVYSTLSDAAMYFDSINNPFLTAYVNHCLGNLEKDKYNSLAAMNYYLRARIIMDSLCENYRGEITTKNPEYLRLSGRNYNGIAGIFWYDCYWEQSIECMEAANEYFLKNEELDILASNFRTIGGIASNTYDTLNLDYEYYFHKADSLNRITNADTDGYELRSMKKFRIFKSFQNGHIEGAYDSIHSLLSKATREIEKPSYWWVLAYFHFQEYHDDSAIYYFEKCLPLQQRIATIETYNDIITCSKAIGDTAKIAYYTHLLSQSGYEEVERNTSKSEALSLYSHYKTEKEGQRASAIHRNKLLIILLSAFLLTIIVLRLLFKKHRDSKKKEEYHNWYVKLLLGRVRAKSSELDEKTSQLESLKQDLRDMQEKQSLMEERQFVSLEDSMKAFHEADIIKEVLTIKNNNFIKSSERYPELSLTNTQMKQLLEAVDKHFPGFGRYLSEHYPKLSKSDFPYCYLYLIGLNDSEAAALTGKSYHTVYMRSNKLHDIFGSKADLQWVLTDILKQYNLRGSNV